MVSALLIVYGLGFIVTWIGAARSWLKDFGQDEIFTAGGWGFFVGLLWPLVAIGYSGGYIARLTIRGAKS